MQVVIWEKSPLQQAALRQLFAEAGHAVTVVSHYKGLHQTLQAFAQQPLVLVVNTHALSKVQQLHYLHNAAPQASLIALCHQQDLASQLAVLEAGADTYLTQPFELPLLLAQSEALYRHSCRLRKNRPLTTPRSERLGPFQFDFENFSVQVQDHTLLLKKRAFLLLHYLAKHPERVHSRQHLYQVVWAGQFSATSRQIDNLVLALRQQLTPFPQLQIHTVYGEGYLFSCH
ncbi:MAG: response regulator transcription factor [Candidatus Sericytochromatia bacterium]